MPPRKAVGASVYRPKLSPALEQARDRLVLLSSESDLLPGNLQDWKLPEIGLFLTQNEIKRFAKAIN